MTDKLSERLDDAWRKLYADGDEHDVCNTIAEAAELARRCEWQPIETAPKDGREILLFAQGIQAVARWDEFGRGWVMLERGNPNDQWMFASHWMPMPEPPEAEWPATTTTPSSPPWKPPLRAVTARHPKDGMLASGWTSGLTATPQHSARRHGNACNARTGSTAC